MSKESLLNSLIELDGAYGVSGDETAVAEVLMREMEGLYDEYRTDALGNRYFLKYGRQKDKIIAVVAHMDEIGFIISHIEPNGLGRFCPVGYHDDRTCVSQDMVVITDEGKHVYGVTGSAPAHLMSDEESSRVIKMSELFVDFGTETAQETRDLGVEIGCYMTYARSGYLMNGGNYYTGRAIDNRCSCAVMVEVLKALKDVETEYTIAMVGSVQEEVGMRSGAPIAHNLRPVLFLSLDVTFASGTPGTEDRSVSCKMGEGPAIRFYDWDSEDGSASGNNVPRKLTKQMVRIAVNNHIPFQREVTLGGGTDSWNAAMADGGYLAGGISIPQRYMHTPVGTVNLDDLENTVKLTAAVLREYAEE